MSPVARTSLYAAAVVIAVQAILLATGNNAVLHGQMLDPDCYMHLQRAARMMVDGQWHDTLDPRINAPYGFSIHWTALFDTLLVAGATPLTWLGYDQNTALLIWGSAISPVLLIAALSVFAWGARPRVQGAVFVWLTVLIFTQPALWGFFIAGRPDHHSLVAGLLFAQLAWAYSLFDGRTGPHWAVAAGILAGLQLATSVEALLTILLMSGALTAVWLFYGRAVMKDLTLYLAACVATVFAWLIWENGHYLITPAYDRVSLVHLVALGSGTVAMAGVWFAESRALLTNRKRQAVAIGLAVSVAGAITAAIFPDFFLGPWPHLDPLLVAWHKQVTELRPLLPTDLDSGTRFLSQMTACVLALPLVIWRLWRGPDSDKPIMLLSVMGFVLFGALALNQLRWAGELQAVMLLPWTLTTVAIMDSTIAITIGKLRVPLRTFALSGALLLQLLPFALLLNDISFNTFTTHPTKRCAWSKAALALPQSVTQHSIVMAEQDIGPEILWRSNLRVIAGPYEMLSALADTVTFYTGSETTARAVFERRHISYALVCKKDTGRGFGGKLARGIAPNWMKPIPLKGGPAEFRLYRVAY